MLPFSVEQSEDGVVIIRMSGIKEGWRQLFLLTSDRHHDNPHTRQDLEKKHLKKAKERNAGIIDLGDLHCAMQGKYDPRSKKADCRPEHCDGDYLDLLVDSASDFYAPYASNWVVMAEGNHESAIRNRLETSLTKRLAGKLNDKTGSNIFTPGYEGWIKFFFERHGTCRSSKTLWYTHGYGGGGPVTEDMIQSNRQRVYVDADIMVSGHVHRSWCQEFCKVGLDHLGRQYRREGWYIKTPTYKDAYGSSGASFEKERGHGPRPLGAWWLEFFYESGQIKMRPFKASN